MRAPEPRQAMTFWQWLIIAIAAADVFAKRKDPNLTISQGTRVRVHTDHPIGRTLFILAWGSFATWFGIHIVDHEYNRRTRV